MTGTLNMTGGTIRQNTTASTNSGKGKGGGVYLASSQNTFTVSGDAVVSGNVRGGTITNGTLSGGEANNYTAEVTGLGNADYKLPDTE